MGRRAAVTVIVQLAPMTIVPFVCVRQGGGVTIVRSKLSQMFQTSPCMSPVGLLSLFQILACWEYCWRCDTSCAHGSGNRILPQKQETGGKPSESGGGFTKKYTSLLAFYYPHHLAKNPDFGALLRSSRSGKMHSLSARSKSRGLQLVVPID